MQPTVVIALENARYFDNYLACPPSFVTRNGIRVIVHTSPETVVSASTTSKNYDILIDGNASFLTSEPNTIKILRHGKVQQAEHLVSAYEMAGKDVRIRNVLTWGFRRGFISAPSPSDLGIERVIVKPENGARGIYQSVFNISDISIAKVHDWYVKADSFEDWLNNKPANVEISDVEKYTDRDKLMFSGLKEHLVLQEYIQDIMTEYRVIFRADYINDVYVLYHQPRALLGTKIFKQAIGSDESPKTCTRLETGPLADFVNTILPHLNTPFGSLDVFYTTDHKYGVFEYQGQYGIKGLGDIGTTMFMDFLEDTAEFYALNNFIGDES